MSELAFEKWITRAYGGMDSIRGCKSESASFAHEMKRTWNAAFEASCAQIKELEDKIEADGIFYDTRPCVNCGHRHMDNY